MLESLIKCSTTINSESKYVYLELEGLGIFIAPEEALKLALNMVDMIKEIKPEIFN